jgi:hypothetical protein
MQGSVGYVIWTIFYLAVLAGLSAYGVHRYFIIYLFLKNRKHAPVPARQFTHFPKVTMQLPIFNEIYVVERLLRSVSEIGRLSGNLISMRQLATKFFQRWNVELTNFARECHRRATQDRQYEGN